MVFKKGQPQSWREVKKEFDKEAIKDTHTHTFDRKLGENSTSEVWGCECGEYDVRDKMPAIQKVVSRGITEQEHYAPREPPTESLLLMFECMNDAERLAEDFKWMKEQDLARVAVALFQTRYIPQKPKKKGWLK